MSEEKKKNEKRETKAGMLAKNQKQTATGKDKAKSEKDTKDTPKISKETAEESSDDKPLH